jgi:diaminopimelate decarboxylase
MTALATPAEKLADLDFEALAGRFGTPLFVYDLDAIDRQVAALRAILPARFALAYAVKANPALGIVGHLGRLGLGADVASGGELATANRAGIPPDRIVFTGPGKRDDELEQAVIAGLRAITVESLGELARVESLSARFRVRTPVLLRLAVDGNVGDKFGIDPSDLARVAMAAVKSAHIRLLGLHAFGASNVLDAEVLAAHAERTMAVAREIIERVRTHGDPAHGLDTIDIGGGLGLPYASDRTPLDLAALGRRLAALDDAWREDSTTADTHVLLEPGRFLVGPAGFFLTRVIERKVIAGRAVVIVDGGIHNLLRPALAGEPHRIVRIGAPEDTGAGEAFTVAGPLCSGLDALARDVSLDRAEPGDLLAVLDTGAYGYTESMPLFLSHPMPAEVALSGGRTVLLRPRIEPETWLAQQLDPGW